MRKLIWSINVSLDGFADHTIGIGVDDDLFGFFGDLLDDMDLVVFGRVTYQLMEAAWPNAGKDPNASRPTRAFADRFDSIPKVVFSRTLDRTAWSNTRIVRDDMVDEVTRLKQQPGRNILIDGISVAREFVKRGMIDEYWFVVHPIVAGKGTRVVDEVDEGVILRLLDTRVFSSGAVALHYENRGNGS